MDAILTVRLTQLYNINLVDRPGIEPGTEACKATVFSFIPTAHVWHTPLDLNQA